MKLTKHEKKVVKAFGIALSGSFVLGGVALASGYVYASEKVKEIQDNIINELSSRLLKIKDVSYPVESAKEKDSLKCLNVNVMNEAGNYVTSQGTLDKETIVADMMGITSSVINRAAKEGKTVCEIVYSICNPEKGTACYSWTKQSQFSNSPERLKKQNPVKWDLATRMNQGILTKHIDIISDIQWYANPVTAGNTWHLQMVKQGIFVPYAAIGDHVFYKLKKQNRTSLSETVLSYLGLSS